MMVQLEINKKKKKHPEKQTWTNSKKKTPLHIFLVKTEVFWGLNPYYPIVKSVSLRNWIEKIIYCRVHEQEN